MAWRQASVIILLLYVCSMGFGQGDSDPGKTITTEAFISPVDHNIRLAGSFGELRSNHFHAGIDIKSRTGEEGDTIRSSMSGYVSRIKIQRGGYGQVLYINHPNGYTSVYAHLRSFAPKLQDFITQWQNSSQSYEVDIYPEPNKFKFTQGESIGLMGNTGRSYGPHLHFEIRKTDTEIPENPYLHNIGPTDERKPLLYAVEAHGLDSEHHKIWSRSQAIGKQGASKAVTFSIPAWRAGIAIQTFDLMDGASNKNGVYSIEMKVDDSLHYSHVMDRVGFDVSKYINSHIDYGEKKTNNRTLTKLYVSPGNRLDFYPTIVDRGEIKLYKDQPRKIDISIKDFMGNERTYTCYLKRREAKEGEIAPKSFQKFVKHNQVNVVKLGSSRFTFPANAFDKNTYLDYEEKISNGRHAFRLNTEADPMFGYPGVSVPLTGISDTSLFSKAILVHQDKTSYGGHVENDSLRVRFGAMGEYTVEIDTIPPTLEVGSFLKNAVGKPFFRFAIKDNYEVRGYASDVRYDVFIDGKWVIASLKALGNVMIVPLTEVPSGEHTIKIKLEDDVGNVSVWEREFRN